MAKKGKKAELWISAVLYLLIISIVMSIVLQAGLPMLKNLRDKSIVLQTRDNFINLDKHIQEIDDAGPGSQRVVPFEIKKGDLKVEDGRVLWEFDTEAEIMQPGSSQKSGNLRLGLNADVKASEQSDRYTLQNSYIKAVFSKIGNATVFQPINTSGIVKYMEFVDTGGQANDPFTFK